tara:strand:+ start:70 stop:234 length:165 start_codon:yes stop_codon:yes gene_type:complete
MLRTISVFLLITGLIMISIGYAHQVSPTGETSREIEFVPRDVYDELELSSVLST